LTVSRNLCEPAIDDLRDIERAMLEAIKSEVEAIVADVEGVYLNASLIVPDPEDESRIKCINRANTARKIPKSYKKDGMLAWECMRTGEMQHDPSFSKPGSEYRSILCMPLYIDGDEIRGLGAVSIDHEHSHAFTGQEQAVKISLNPYLRMLELVLVLRDRIAHSPSGGHEAHGGPRNS
jgi:hypothetical protein